MEAARLVDPYNPDSRSATCIVKRTSRTISTPYEQFLRVLNVTEGLLAQGNNTGASTTTDGYPTVSISSVSAIIPVLKRWASRSTSPMLTNLIQSLSNMVDSNVPYTMVKVDPSTLISLGTVIKSIQSDCEIRVQQIMLLKLFQYVVAPTSFPYALDEQTAVPIGTGLTVITSNVQANAIWKGVMASSSADIGYISGGSATSGDLFLMEFCDLQASLLAMVNATQARAHAEFQSMLPLFSPGSKYPSGWTIPANASIRVVLSDWIKWYQTGYTIDIRKVLLPGLWEEDLDATNWDQGEYSCGFRTSTTTKDKWAITRFLILHYPTFGLALRRRQA
ncbi:P10 gene product [Spissistilus festinus reovirus]|uniref:P10 n=1 Tax=Spissistilus festinus reovirus TaxID=1004049 RepID=UPI00024D9475|nr:P10 gene product [Spissistilus festinus reovirus]AEC32496.1 spike protein [Spissistilus festinus reovirus]